MSLKILQCANKADIILCDDSRHNPDTLAKVNDNLHSSEQRNIHYYWDSFFFYGVIVLPHSTEQSVDKKSVTLVRVNAVFMGTSDRRVCFVRATI